MLDLMYSFVHLRPVAQRIALAFELALGLTLIVTGWVQVHWTHRVGSEVRTLELARGCGQLTITAEKSGSHKSARAFSLSFVGWEVVPRLVRSAPQAEYKLFVSVPLWPAWFALLVVVTLLGRGHVPDRACCRHCQYPRTGLPDHVCCPECGSG